MKNHRCYSTIETSNDNHPKKTPSNQNHQPLIYWPPRPIKHLIMMKLWLLTWPLPNHSNPHRTFPSNTLYIRHINSILISYPHLSRRKLRLTYPLYTCKRSLHILHLPFSSRRTRHILRLLQHNWNLKHRHYLTIRCNSNSIHGLRPTMRTNILLRSHSNYKSTISYPLHRHNPSRMNLRGILSRQSHSHTILRIPLHPAFHHHSPRFRPLIIPTRNRIQQPNRSKLRRGQNPIPPLLYNQRFFRGPYLINRSHNFGTVFPRCSRRPR